MTKTFLVLTLAMFCAGVGNIFFSKGMKRADGLLGWRPSLLFRFFWRAMKEPFIWLGIFTSAVYFFLWLIVLSWAEVSWALPMNAVEYLLVAFLALMFLKERIDKSRWAGIFLISLGIFFMMRSW